MAKIIKRLIISVLVSFTFQNAGGSALPVPSSPALTALGDTIEATAKSTGQAAAQQATTATTSQLNQLLKTAQNAPFGVSIGLQGITSAGLQFAFARINEQERRVLEPLIKQQIEAVRDFDEYQKTLSTKRNEAIIASARSLANEKKKLEEQYQISAQRLQNEIRARAREVAMAKPSYPFLESRIEWDRFFETSSMPVHASQWHNIFNVFSADDWHYEQATKRFWQRSLNSFPTRYFWQQPLNAQNLIEQDPSIHHIFTEYVTAALSYDIEVECTLVNYQYPFFIGVLFNKGRWISGDTERVWWYRMLGIYGSFDTSLQEKPSLVLSEMQINNPSQGAKRTIVSPFQRLIEGQAVLQAPLAKELIASAKKDPLTFICSIKNEASKVSLSVRTSTNQELYRGEVSGLDEFIFRFHGIGFMAVGCQAYFSLKKPDLLKTSEPDNPINTAPIKK